ncbi:MAG: DNA repair protein RadC [Bacilli bacterium]|nr:DNA repair protein RadC [Bacilli bacterium]
MKIKDIPVLDRPIERLITKGVDSLSNEELIAILLRTGSKCKSAKELASQLISIAGSLKDLSYISYEQLKSINGIGKSKACILLSTFELAKRINMRIDTIINMKANNPKLIFEYYKELLKDKKQEHFYALYLDTRARVIKDKLLFIGTINYSVVHPREVFKEAYLAGASSIILLHNHPAGSVMPSSNDIDTTKKLKEIGDLMGIKVIDHIIIGNDKYYSFYENKDL